MPVRLQQILIHRAIFNAQAGIVKWMLEYFLARIPAPFPAIEFVIVFLRDRASAIQLRVAPYGA